MRFGLALPSYSFPDLDYRKAARLRDFATGAEARGYESLWVIDRQPAIPLGRPSGVSSSSDRAGRRCLPRCF